MTKERILEILEGAKDETASVPMSLVRKAFENISNEPQWIPCSERLPESNQEVLVCGDNGNIDVIIGFTVDGIDNRWIWQMTPKLLFVKEIVAWQPLPEPYKKEGGEI